MTSETTSKTLLLLQPFSWASVTSKNLPPSGAVPVSGIPPHVVKVAPAAPVGPAPSLTPPPHLSLLAMLTNPV